MDPKPTTTYDYATSSWNLSDCMTKCLEEKKAGLKVREHKLPDWDENYLLYRNKVRTNRLTQRQSVNIPLMKETVKTLLAKIDDIPDIEWKELSGDEQKELVYQEIWNEQGKQNKFELVDFLDKKNVLLYGLSTRKLNISDEGVIVTVEDNYDISYDPLTLPSNIESARWIDHLNIFRTLREILASDRYTQEGKDSLKIWANTPKGLVQSNENRKAWDDKNERMKAMGVQSDEFKYFAGGDVIVNLTEHYTNEWNNDTLKFERRVVVFAEDTIELCNDSLQECVGVTFWPFILWSEDPETNDIYPDAIADLVRTPNKVVNIWYSQLIESRTLKNFQMHWYSPVQGYTPQTYTPGPGVMLPAPPGDDINKVLKPVQIDGLDDTLAAINAITGIVERGSGATAIEKGQPEAGVQTLGEVQILVGKAQDRATAMAKFYRMAWYELACKWDGLMQANAPKMMKLFKVSRSGKAYPKTVIRGDYVSKAGYEPIVQSSSEQETEITKAIQRFSYLMTQFPNNQVLKEIAQKRMLKLVDLSPEELRMVEEGNKAAAAPVAPDPNLVNQNKNMDTLINSADTQINAGLQQAQPLPAMA